MHIYILINAEQQKSVNRNYIWCRYTLYTNRRQYYVVLSNIIIKSCIYTIVFVSLMMNPYEEIFVKDDTLWYKITWCI
jgi:hypothetical protein